MAESSEELIKLIKLMDELLKDTLPNNWNPLTFKEFVYNEKTKEDGTYYVSDWGKRFLMSDDGVISIDWSTKTIMKSGVWVNNSGVWKDGVWLHNNGTWIIDNPFDDYTDEYDF